MQQRRSASWGWFTAGLATILAVGASLVPVSTASAASVVFEAEAETNIRTGQARVLDRPEASGGKAIGYVGGGNGTIGIKVDVIDPARTSLTLKWISGENRDIRYTCNGGAETLLDLPVGPNWSTPQSTPLTCAGLTAGENTITLWNTTPAPDIDALVVSTSQQVIFEAEDPSNDLTGQARVQERAGASGGKTVGYIGGGNGTLGVRVSIEAAGQKEFELQYISGEKRDIRYQCPGASESTLLNLPAGPNWSTPVTHEFSCYIPQGLHVITLYNTGPAPDVDLLRMVGGIDDGGGPVTTPTPTQGYPTEDPWADDPANAKPASAQQDPDWMLIDDYSSEFSGTDVEGKFSRFPDQWGWRAEWRWDDEAAVVQDGNLELKQSYDPTNNYNVVPKGWQTALVDLNLQNANTDTVTTYAAHTGNTGLRHTYFNQYGTRTQQTFTGLAAGTHQFSAYAKSEGTEGTVALVAKNCTAAGSEQREEIPRSNGGWKQYSLVVDVVAGSTCVVALESTGKTFSDVAMFDDAVFTAPGVTTNRLANPGFETLDTTHNKSGGVHMTEPVKYGYFEVRAKSGTPFPGTCLAFWLDGREGDYSTELDIVELGEKPGNPNAVDFAAHRWPSKALGPNHQSNGGDVYQAPWDPSADFHTYGFEWEPGVQRWFVDGVLRAERKDPVFDAAEQYMILSLGLRAPYVNNPAAYPNAYDNAKPSQFDYVRVWKPRAFEVPSTVVGDYQASFVYSDGWTASGGNRTSGTAGATWKLRFDGDGVDVVAPAGAGQGRVAYSIDGGQPIVVDHGAATSSTVWSSPVVPRGKHVVTARVVSGAVGVSSVIVRNTLDDSTPSPSPSQSPAPTVTVTTTATAEPSITYAPTVTATSSATATATSSTTATATSSATATVTSTVTTTASATATATANVTVTTTVTGSTTPTVTTAPVPQPVDIYTAPGIHEVNGRRWFTTCEAYSATFRCTTQIWSTQISEVNGTFVSTTGWHFNNLTYVASPRSLWAGNPLAVTGSWTATDGRRWRTECDTAVTGGNGCRSWVTSRIIESTRQADGTYRHAWVTKEVFNNMVRFS
ncbi:MAG: family 16 glycosylhydrolase [Propionibacteriaceae bacterium]|nr:family 16 glycosylhydrolase [Propionibacteriaceae bacterium]